MTSKPDSSRKKLYEAKIHEKKSLLHVHVSKSLKTRMKAKKRSILVKKGDKVRIMCGSMKGKEGKVAIVNYIRTVVFVEGMTVKGARGKETMVPFQPSNLMLIDVDMGGSRKELFTEAKAEAKPAAVKPTEKLAVKPDEVSKPVAVPAETKKDG